MLYSEAVSVARGGHFRKKNGSALSYVTLIIQSSVTIRVTHVDLVYTKCILGVETDRLTQFLFSDY